MSIPLAIVTLSFAFLYLVMRLHSRDREQQRRAVLVEKALESGAIDDATKRELLDAVTRRSSRRTTPSPHPLLMLGWLGLFVGGGMMIIATEPSSRDLWKPAVLVTLISFGVMSLPIAMRELQARKHA